MSPRATDRRSAAPPRTLRPDGPQLAVGRPNFRVSVVEDLAEARRLAGDWEDLRRAAGSSPFCGPDYALGWWVHRGRGRLQVVTVRFRGELVALAPLHARDLAGQRVVRWLGHGLGTVGEVLVRPGHAAAATSLWAELAGDPRVLLDLLEFRDDGGGLAELRRHRALRCTASLRDVCPVVELDEFPSGEALLERLHNRHPLRRSVNRARRHLAEQGTTARVEVGEDVDGLRSLWPAFEQVYDAAELHRPRLHLLRPPWREFMVDLLEEWADQERVALQVLRLDDRPAAAEIIVEDAGTSYAWIARFDPAAAEFSPGHLLSLESFDRARARGNRRVDLLLGDGPHKLPWATASYDTLTVRAASRAVTARSLALGGVTGARAGADRVLDVLRRARGGAR